MNTAQDTYILPDDIAAGLASGIYTRIGSVVRMAIGPENGQIVRHLQPACSQDGSGENAAEESLEMVQDNPAAFIIPLLIAGGAAAAACLWQYAKRRRSEDEETFRNHLDWYMAAAENGAAEPEYMSKVAADYSRLKGSRHWERIIRSLTQDELDALTACICYDRLHLAPRRDSIAAVPEAEALAVAGH